MSIGLNSLELQKNFSKVFWNPFDSERSLLENSTEEKIGKVVLTIFLSLATGCLFLAFPTILWCINWINPDPESQQGTFKQKDEDSSDSPVPDPGIFSDQRLATNSLTPLVGRVDGLASPLTSPVIPLSNETSHSLRNDWLSLGDVLIPHERLRDESASESIHPQTAASLLACKHVKYVINFLMGETFLPGARLTTLSDDQVDEDPILRLPREMHYFVNGLLDVVITDQMTQFVHPQTGKACFAPIDKKHLENVPYLRKVGIKLFEDVFFKGEIDPVIQKGRAIRSVSRPGTGTSHDPVIKFMDFGRGFLDELASLDAKFSQFLQRIPASTVDKLFEFPPEVKDSGRTTRTMLEFCRLPVALQIIQFIMGKLRDKMVLCFSQSEAKVIREDIDYIITFCKSFHDLMQIMYNEHGIEKVTFSEEENRCLGIAATDFFENYAQIAAKRAARQSAKIGIDTVKVIEKYTKDPLVVELKGIIDNVKAKNWVSLAGSGLCILFTGRAPAVADLYSHFSSLEQGDITKYSNRELQTWIDGQARSSKGASLPPALEKEVIRFGFKLLKGLSENSMIQSILAIPPRPLLHHVLGLPPTGPLTILSILRAPELFDRLQDIRVVVGFLLKDPRINEIFDLLIERKNLFKFLVSKDELESHSQGISLFTDFDGLTGEPQASIKSDIQAVAERLVGARYAYFAKHKLL